VLPRLALVVAGLWKSRPRLWLAGLSWVVLLAAYFLIFLLTRPEDAPRLLSSAFFNASVFCLLASAVLAGLPRLLGLQPVFIQLLVHIAAAVLFCLLWYLGVIILLGWRDGSLSTGFIVEPFGSIAFAWQILQGLLGYAAVVAAGYALHYRDMARSLASQNAARQPAFSTRLMVRGPDGLVSLAVADVVKVTARGDYCEITVSRRSFSTRKSLTEIASGLDPSQFVRLHRSVLVNLDAVISAEPAGDGRLTVHLHNGDSVPTSKAGARLLRELSI